MYSRAVEELLHAERLQTSLPTLRLRPSVMEAQDVLLPQREKLCADAAFMRARRKAPPMQCHGNHLNGFHQGHLRGRTTTKGLGFLGIVRKVQESRSHLPPIMGSRDNTKNSLNMSVYKSTDNQKLLDIRKKEDEKLPNLV